MLAFVVVIIFPLCMAYAAFSDVVSMTIPNRIALALLATFFVCAPLTGMTLTVVSMHVLAGAITFAVCFALFAANVMGGGDAKLLTACAVWFGLSANLIVFLVNVSMIGGLLTVAFIVLRARVEVQALAHRFSLPSHLFDRTAGIPYGLAIGIGGLICYPQTELMQWALARLAA